MKNRLWTADRLQKRGLQHPSLCPLCSQEQETGVHLMVQCVFAHEVWFRTMQLVGMQGFAPAPDTDVAPWWTTLSAAIPKEKRKTLNSLVILTVRSIWLERNCRVFDRVASTATAVCSRIRHELELWIAASLCREI